MRISPDRNESILCLNKHNLSTPGRFESYQSHEIHSDHDVQQDLFDEDRLIELGRANHGRSAQEIQQAILASVDEFAGDAPQSDDITLMVLIRK